MERLPYIDEHATSVKASRATTWDALLRVTCRGGTEPLKAMNGFVVDSATPLERLALSGRHPFSIYELVFVLEEDGPDQTIVRAQTWADFPGVHGKVYRALVISSGLHKIATRLLLLGRIAATAERAGENVA
jgi:hypothetical protein